MENLIFEFTQVFNGALLSKRIKKEKYATIKELIQARIQFYSSSAFEKILETKEEAKKNNKTIEATTKCFFKNGHWYTNSMNEPISRSVFGYGIHGSEGMHIFEQYDKFILWRKTADMDFDPNDPLQLITDLSYEQTKSMIASLIFIDDELYRRCHEPIVKILNYQDKQHVEVSFPDVNEPFLNTSSLDQRINNRLLTFNELYLMEKDDINILNSKTKYINNKNFSYKFDDDKIFIEFINGYYNFIHKHLLDIDKFKLIHKNALLSFWKIYSSTKPIEDDILDDLQTILTELEKHYDGNNTTFKYGMNEIYNSIKWIKNKKIENELSVLKM